MFYVRTISTITIVLCALSISTITHANAIETLQNDYHAAGAGPFSAAAGEKLWKSTYKNAKDGRNRSCQSCHGEDLSASGKHIKTGKVIKPIAPSVNGERLTDIKFIKKWFKRNCKWTLGRKCTAQEKGDFLEYLRSQ